jgi:uncharacterized protein
MAKISLLIDESHSLKEKRMVLRRIKDRVRERAHVIMNEVGAQDMWQRAELGCAVASSDRTKALEVIDEVVRVAMSAGGAQIAGIAKDVVTFDPGGWSESSHLHSGALAEPLAPIDDRTGAGDKAQGSDDFIPDEWRDEMDRK